MKMLTKEVEKRIPELYSHDGKDAAEVPVAVKFFDPSGSFTWYVTEGNKLENGDWSFFGLVDSGFYSELSYFRLSDLLNAKTGLRGLKALPIERDLNYSGTLKDALGE